MIRRIKPLKRSWIKRKPRVRKVSWRNPGRVREDAAGMYRLRFTVYDRSYYHGDHSGPYHRCENKLESGRRCSARITWETMELHHLGPACERSDTPEKTMAACSGCHFDTTNEIWKASRWDA